MPARPSQGAAVPSRPLPPQRSSPGLAVPAGETLARSGRESCSPCFGQPGLLVNRSVLERHSLARWREGGVRAEEGVPPQTLPWHGSPAPPERCPRHPPRRQPRALAQPWWERASLVLGDRGFGPYPSSSCSSYPLPPSLSAGRSCWICVF